LKKKLEERFREGEKEGIKKGREIYYGKGIVRGEYDEHQRWKAEGHGQHCCAASACLENSKIQTDAPDTITTSVGTQTEHPTHLKLVNALVDMMPTPKMALNAMRTNSSDYIECSPSVAVSDILTPTTIAPALETCPITPGFTQKQSGNIKNSKMDCTSEILMDSTHFSSSTPSVVVSNSGPHSTTSTALETRSRTAHFAPKLENLEKSPIPSQTTHSHNPFEHTDEAPRVQTTLKTSNDVISQPLTPSTTASSLGSPLLVAANSFEKRAGLIDGFKSSPSDTQMEFVSPAVVVPALETRQKTAGFIQNRENIEKSPIFVHSNTLVNPQPSPTPVLTQIEHSGRSVLENASPALADTSLPPATTDLEIGAGFGDKVKTSLSETFSDIVAPAAVVSGLETHQATTDFTQNHTKSQNPNVLSEKYTETSKSSIPEPFSWSDDANALHISSTFPQYPPRDLSCLRSTSTRPFLSLQRRRGHPKNRRRWNAHCSGYHSYPIPAQNRPLSYTPFRVPISLDWDRDPRLADLSSALRALGWCRR
jgi:hypothetical protein